MTIYALTILLTGPPDEAAACRPELLEHLRQLEAAGRLRSAGELSGGEGLLALFEAEDRHQAEETARSNPLVSRGLGSWILRPWEELSL